MTSPKMPRGWRSRLPVFVLVLAVVGGISLLATAGAEGTLTYYRTPTELLAAPTAGHDVRLEGLVVAGSIHRDDSTVAFVLSDGTHQIEVVSHSVPPQTFRAGQAAVVDGVLDQHQIFQARSVVVRHNNQYEPSTS